MDGTRKYVWCPGFRKEARLFLRAAPLLCPDAVCVAKNAVQNAVQTAHTPPHVVTFASVFLNDAGDAARERIAGHQFCVESAIGASSKIVLRSADFFVRFAPQTDLRARVVSPQRGRRGRN
jgi:hypothetical protein